MSLLRCFLAFAVVGFAVSSDGGAPVVVTGATGGTGVLTYNLLKSRGVAVRALVRNTTKARDRLGCTKCDESEGIFEGDVTKPDSLAGVMEGAGSLVIITSAMAVCNPFPTCGYPKGAFPIDIDWNGGKNQVEAFVKGAGGLKPVILVSSMGTTEPNTGLDKMGDGQILFYKLNFESFLMSSGLPYTIVKPCGLGNDEPEKDTLIVGHDDAEEWDMKNPIQRSDVARVLAAAVESSDTHANLRFDLCAKPGAPTRDVDIPSILKAAEYPWQQSQMFV